MELAIRKRLNHPNVVLAFGANTDIAEFCIVTPWMPEGGLLQYLQKYPGANRVGIVRSPPPILATRRTEHCVQDVWSHRWALLPSPQ